MNKLTMIVDFLTMDDVVIDKDKIGTMLKNLLPDIDSRIPDDVNAIDPEDEGIDLILTITAFEHDDDSSFYTNIGIDVGKSDGSKSIAIESDEKIEINETRIYAGIHYLLGILIGSKAIDKLM